MLYFYGFYEKIILLNLTVLYAITCWHDGKPYFWGKYIDRSDYDTVQCIRMCEANSNPLFTTES